ncbi:hypothetical protein SAMN04488109_3189 [Chryseolinea serpens]|uniref:Uncharacterized protein n=1 Tax=Chryseolinea serpens TaxID=947013 RepID=A0A1M5R4C5_9BACT|nr:hypothetical protein [Chryseolinea serpens]SHH21257.1 hypothetical protein SAMN04488109_3189 [Chryseolinea serpens]
MPEIFLFMLLNASGLFDRKLDDGRCADVFLIENRSSTTADSKPPPDTTRVFKAIQVFYQDTITNPGKALYREFFGITDEYFSKPAVIDVKILLNKPKNGDVQVFIEELFEPDTTAATTAVYGKDRINSEAWVLHEVVDHIRIEDLQKQKILVTNNVKYKTGYSYGSYLYTKTAFRVVALFKPRGAGKMEIIKKEFRFSM